MTSRGVGRTVFTSVALAGLLLSATGCGYLKNVRDDFLDCHTFAVGIVPPVFSTSDGELRAIGLLPPAIGAYAQVTDFLSLGALFKGTLDANWDRRALSVAVDRRMEVGLGPFHYIYIKQRPIVGNDYVTTGNELDGWRAEMDNLKDIVFGAPAKTLIYEPVEDQVTGCAALPYLTRGWQSWETISLEVAVPEPFVLHSGFYVRAGCDPSEAFDFLLSLFGIDLYGDAAYKCWSGEPKYPAGQQ